MRDVSTEIKVGMVVIAAIVILLYGIIWVKGYQFTVGHYDYTALFPQVGSLSIGDPVSVLGVRKGDVKAIKLSDDRVSVTISLASDVKLKTDANDNRKLREIANLNGAANEILAEIGAINQKEDAMQTVDIEEPVRERIPKAPSMAYTRVKIVASDETGASLASSESSYLSEALKHQAASDSLKDLAAGAHARVRESEDPNDRWVWQKQIMVWEKKAREEEEKADILFAAHSQESMEVTPAHADTEPADLEGEPGT